MQILYSPYKNMVCFNFLLFGLFTEVWMDIFCCQLHGGRILKCLDAGKRKRVIEDDDEEGPAAKKSRTDSGCQVIFSCF